MRIYLKTAEEIAKLRKVNLVVNSVLDAIEETVRPGVSTYDLNETARRVMEKHGATPAFLGYHGYPAVLCASVNEVVVHGIPRKDIVLADGDIVGLDFGCFLDGYCGDAARTVAAGKPGSEAVRLMQATRESLEQAISCCIAGNRLQDIGRAVQSHVEKRGYSVVRAFVGHGIGKSMHEDPAVPNYVPGPGEAGQNIRLKPGLVLAIEPMVNQGKSGVKVLSDGWTAVTEDGSLSAHFEHSVAITEGEPLVLSRP